MFEERVTVNVSGDGFIEVFSATQAMGQGIATSYAQLVVDVFGVPIEKVRIVQGDTDRGSGFGSAGSRSIFVGGSAVQVASQRTVDKAQNLAAEALEAAPKDIEYREGVFRVVGTDRQIGLFDLAAKQSDHQVFVDSTSAVQAPSWPNACHICEVEIDPDTGAVEVASYASVNDVGRVINPTIVIGQLDGGAVQGMGQALCEQVVYDARIGPAADRHADGLRAAARGHGQELQDRARPEHAVPDQPAGRQGRGRARHHRRHAGGGECGGRRAEPRRRR